MQFSRQQDWNLKFKKEGAHSAAYFVTEKSASPHDPIGVRSSASPLPTSLPCPSRYSSSLRSTHVDPEPEADSDQAELLPPLHHHQIQQHQQQLLQQQQQQQQDFLRYNINPPTPDINLGYNPDNMMNFNPTFNTGLGSMDGMFGLGGGSGAMGGGGMGFGGGGMGLNSALDGAPAMFPPDGSIFDWGMHRSSVLSSMFKLTQLRSGFNRELEFVLLGSTRCRRQWRGNVMG